MPIFITRLVDDSGESITGGRATAGNRLASVASRSCTNCRARIRSVPSSKISTTDDNPSTDFERIVFSQGMPLSAFSSGMLIRLSTSSVDSPGASVWISTSGGANSGKTSSGVVSSVRMPKIDQHGRQRQHDHAQSQRGGDEPGHRPSTWQSRTRCRKVPSRRRSPPWLRRLALAQDGPRIDDVSDSTRRRT